MVRFQLFIMSALTGSELLAKVKQLETEGLGKNDMARQTGYVSIKKDGTEKIDRAAFLEALLQAKGVSLGDGQRPVGRKLTFRTRVQFNGNLMIGAAYTAQSGFGPGDEFHIAISKKGFTLKPVSQSADLCPDGTCSTSEQHNEQPDHDAAESVDPATQSIEEVEF